MQLKIKVESRHGKDCLAHNDDHPGQSMWHVGKERRDAIGRREANSYEWMVFQCIWRDCPCRVLVRADSIIGVVAEAMEAK